MPYKDPEKRKQRSREYHMENRDKIRERNQKNKDKENQQNKEYNQTPQGIKSCRISTWKKRGVVCDNWDAMYDHYTSTSYCDICRVELSIKKERCATTKCLDHCHDTGLFRNILCLACNVKRK